MVTSGQNAGSSGPVNKTITHLWKKVRHARWHQVAARALVKIRRDRVCIQSVKSSTQENLAQSPARGTTSDPLTQSEQSSASRPEAKPRLTFQNYGYKHRHSTPAAAKPHSIQQYVCAQTQPRELGSRGDETEEVRRDVHDHPPRHAQQHACSGGGNGSGSTLAAAAAARLRQEQQRQERAAHAAAAAARRIGERPSRRHPHPRLARRQCSAPRLARSNAQLARPIRSCAPRAHRQQQRSSP
jgi:hypothetical protein